jgi:hypothetical protein
LLLHNFQNQVPLLWGARPGLILAFAIALACWIDLRARQG